MPALIVSIHDVAPATLAQSRAWSRELVARDVPATLLVVPGPWGEASNDTQHAAFVAWVRGRHAAGDEIALHGWSHRADTPGPWWRRLSGHAIARGAAEFWGLDEAEASLRAAIGRDAMHAWGIDPIGFTPPGWLASTGTVSALYHLGFRYSTNHRGVIDLSRGIRHLVPVVCHRPGGLMQLAGAFVVRRAVPGMIRRGRSIRLGLHPADLEHAKLRRAALDAIDQALALGARPLTYRDLLDSPPLEHAA